MTIAKTPKEKILSALYDKMRESKNPQEQESWLNILEVVTEVLDQELK